MRKSFYFFFLIITTFLNSNSWSSISEKKSNLDEIKQDLAESNSKIIHIKASIQELEKNLGKKNQDYVKNVGRIKALEDSIQNQEIELQKRKDSLDQAKKETSFLAKKLISTAIDEEESAEVLLQRKLLVKGLEKKREEIENHSKITNELILKTKETKEVLAQLGEIEIHIKKVIEDLEDKKRILAEQYFQKVNTVNELEQNLRLRASKPVEEKIASKGKNILDIIPGNSDLPFGSLQTPIRKYLDMKYEDKGVSFLFKENLPIYSVGGGKIVYTGPLAGYGQAILVDHGNDIRSLLVGNFKNQTEKGQVVKANEVLGYTEVSADQKDNSIYFEIRKKNIAQNTFLWFDKNIRLSSR